MMERKEAIKRLKKVQKYFEKAIYELNEIGHRIEFSPFSEFLVHESHKVERKSHQLEQRWQEFYPKVGREKRTNFLVNLDEYVCCKGEYDK